MDVKNVTTVVAKFNFVNTWVFTGSSRLDKQPLADDSVKPSLLRPFVFFENDIDLHHFWPNVQDKAFLLQSGDTFSHVCNLTSILIVD